MPRQTTFKNLDTFGVARKRKRPEGQFNDKLRAGLAGYDPNRVENAVGPGTPDIEYTAGWIESKALESLPIRASTRVAVDHYVPKQRAWHVRRRQAGGRVHVALYVRDTREAFIFDALDAAQHLGIDWTADDMRRHAVCYLNPWSVEGFQDWLAVELLK